MPPHAINEGPFFPKATGRSACASCLSGKPRMVPRSFPLAGRLSALLMMASATGCAGVVSPERAPTEADFATIQPGMRSQEVVGRFGRPTWVFGVRQEDLTIWNYRFNRSDCIIYQVSVRP